jgi:nicotinate-nucleotide pyrophosphorylase (carboxylating)
MNDLFDDFLALALREDIGDGDHTSLACIKPSLQGSAKLLAKDTGVLAGIDAVSRILKRVDPELTLQVLILDGATVKPDDVPLVVHGSIQSILAHERLILNIIQRMSAIATETRRFVKTIEATPCRILDTRKTAPGLRAFDKEAVRIGGADNHRFGLFDQILIKDNHVDAAGGIQPAITRVNKYLRLNHFKLPIEIEVRSIFELQQVLEFGGVDRILLDNFPLRQAEQAVRLTRNSNRFVELEASGGINIRNVLRYARTGVDFISIGSLTHTVRALDFSLKINAPW